MIQIHTRKTFILGVILITTIFSHFIFSSTATYSLMKKNANGTESDVSFNNFTFEQYQTVINTIDYASERIVFMKHVVKRNLFNLPDYTVYIFYSIYFFISIASLFCIKLENKISENEKQ